MPKGKQTVVRLWKKYDGHLRRELIFHKLLELRGDRPIGVSMHIMDGPKNSVWTDPSEFVPLDERTQPIIEEIQALQEQRAGLDSEIVSLYEKLERFKIAKSWH